MVTRSSRIAAGQLLQKPGTSEGPLPIGVSAGYAKRLGGFLNGEPGKVAKVYDAGSFRIFRRQLAQSLVECQQCLGVLGWGRERFVQHHALSVAPVLGAPLATSVVHENVAHRLRRSCKEVAPAVPVGLLATADQAQVGF